VTGAAGAALAVPRLVIWRHGRTEWNAAGRFQGGMDPPLDDVGRQQAVRVAPHLAAQLPAEGTVVVSSDLSRAAETATALTDVLGVPLRLDPRLREHGLGCWEGLTRDEVAARYPDQYADWLAGRPVRDRGGEDATQVVERALAALAALPPAAVAVVVTHGGTAGRLMETLLGLGPDHRRIFGALANCAWSDLGLQSGRWRVTRHNNWVPVLAEGVGTGRDRTASAAAPRQPDAQHPAEGPPPETSDAEAVA
jgi:glucosyl-3-phosphoglycerate phosphatase